MKIFEKVFGWISHLRRFMCENLLTIAIILVIASFTYLFFSGWDADNDGKDESLISLGGYATFLSGIGAFSALIFMSSAYYDRVRQDKIFRNEEDMRDIMALFYKIVYDKMEEGNADEKIKIQLNGLETAYEALVSSKMTLGYSRKVHHLHNKKYFYGLNDECINELKMQAQRYKKIYDENVYNVKGEHYKNSGYYFFREFCDDFLQKKS